MGSYISVHLAPYPHLSKIMRLVKPDILIEFPDATLEFLFDARHLNWGSGCSAVVQNSLNRGFNSRRVLGFLLIFQLRVLNQVPREEAALLIFLNKNGCSSVQLGAKQA